MTFVCFFYDMFVYYMICLFISGMHASIKHGSGGGLVRQMAQAVSERAEAFLHNAALSPCYATQSPPAHLNNVTTRTPIRTHAVPAKRPRGRPPKSKPAQDDGSDGEYTPYKTSKLNGSRGGPRGKRTHCKYPFTTVSR